MLNWEGREQKDPPQFGTRVRVWFPPKYHPQNLGKIFEIPLQKLNKKKISDVNKKIFLQNNVQGQQKMGARSLKSGINLLIVTHF